LNAHASLSRLNLPGRDEEGSLAIEGVVSGREPNQKQKRLFRAMVDSAGAQALPQILRAQPYDYGSHSFVRST
jgi:hypothetical protein